MVLVGESLRRRSFIRLMRHWHGTVSMADIETAFGLSRAQAHRVLRAARDDPVDGVAIGDAAVSSPICGLKQPRTVFRAAWGSVSEYPSRKGIC
jgi:hypothetical protein